MRKLYSANNICKAGCKYCFASWNDLYKCPPSIEAATLDNDSFIIYPCCDGEFFDQKIIMNKLKELTKTAKRIYISISTKREISEDEFNGLIALNNWLKYNEKGFVKFSVSVSTKSMVKEIEPFAAEYDSRLLTAKRLHNSNILSSLNLKPILPFICEDEYYEILRDFSPFVNHVMIGGLYVNPSSVFFKTYIQNKYKCIKRKVFWLDNCPEWYYYENKDKTQSIITFAKTLGMNIYNSDQELINSIRTQME